MVVSETATLLRIEPFWSWNTPIAWTGFIILADSLVYRARGDSWIRSAPREFAALALVSIPLWLVFEWFNLYLRNWHYVGLPENLIVRNLGYAWAFATIWPAIFEGAELAAVVRGSRGSGRAGGAGRAGGSSRANGSGSANGSGRTDRSGRSDHSDALRLPRQRNPLVSSDQSDQPDPPDPPDQPDPPGPPDPRGLRAGATIAAGSLFLAAPFLTPAYAQYLAAPVWLGFILLLDPINARLGTERITRERLINLSLSGLLCGVLWEFWNYWARSKWIYTVPIMENLKVFEMPLPGYLGFPAFALECFTMYVFLRRLITTHGRPIAL